MPKKGGAPCHNFSFSFSRKEYRPRPKLFKQDRRSLKSILVDSVKDYKFRKDEIFKRMKVTTAMLARSVNYESKDMLRFKNQEGKIIIVYDNDETLAHRAATTLVQRGYDNLFMLSGGLKVANKVFPDGLITGTVPEACGGGGVSSKSKAASSPTSQAANKTDFTISDLDCLVTHMDSAMGDNSSSSRLSQRSRGGGGTGRLSTMSNASRVSHGRPAFKP